eukprot:gene6182-12517_t
MVKIINGEIVQDNDPRLRQRTVPQSSSSNSSGTGPRIGRIGGVGNSNGGTDERSSQSPNNNQPPPQPNPIDMLARALGVQDNIITIPAIPAVGFTETRLGLIYVILVVLLCMILGVRALIFSVVVFGLWKHSQRQ